MAGSNADRPRAAAHIRAARTRRERHRSPEVFSPSCHRSFGFRIIGLASSRLPMRCQALTCLPSMGIVSTKVFSQPWKASIFPRLAEWFNASDYESDEEQSSAGSNPAPSAKPLRKRGGLIGSDVYFSPPVRAPTGRPPAPCSPGICERAPPSRRSASGRSTCSGGSQPVHESGRIGIGV